MNRGPAVPTAVQGGGALAGSGVPSAVGQWVPQDSYIRVIVGEPLPKGVPAVSFDVFHFASEMKFVSAVKVQMKVACGQSGGYY